MSRKEPIIFRRWRFWTSLRPWQRLAIFTVLLYGTFVLIFAGAILDWPDKIRGEYLYHSYHLKERLLGHQPDPLIDNLAPIPKPGTIIHFNYKQKDVPAKDR